MKRPIVALLTDFGTRDPYVAQMKAVILSYREDALLIDVTHEVEPFNELEAAFLLASYTPYMPPGTIHLCVVDPGVGSKRRGIVLETVRGDLFIGPDTGFMVPAAERLGLEAAYWIDEDRLPPRVSETFHGRDVFAHVVGRLAAGMSLEEIGRQVDDYRRMELPQPLVRDGVIEAIVMHVDRFGNLVTNLRPELLSKVLGSERLRLSFRGGEIVCGFRRAYGFVEEDEPLLTVGGSGYVELAINRGSAAERFRLKPGDRVRISAAKNTSILKG